MWGTCLPTEAWGGSFRSSTGQLHNPTPEGVSESSKGLDSPGHHGKLFRGFCVKVEGFFAGLRIRVVSWGLNMVPNRGTLFKGPIQRDHVTTPKRLKVCFKSTLVQGIGMLARAPAQKFQIGLPASSPQTPVAVWVLNEYWGLHFGFVVINPILPWGLNDP